LREEVRLAQAGGGTDQSIAPGRKRSTIKFITVSKQFADYFQSASSVEYSRTNKPLRSSFKKQPEPDSINGPDT